MQDIFSTIIRMSLQGTVIFVIIFLVRLLLKKLRISHRYIVGLWMVLFFYLVVPWKLNLPVGFWNNDVVQEQHNVISVQDSVGGILYNTTEVPDMTPEQYPIIESVNASAEGINMNTNMTTLTKDTGSISRINWWQILSYVWLAIALGLFGHLVYSYFLIRKKLLLCTPYKKNIYWAEEIQTPMVFGILCPKIFLPINIRQENLLYVISHEKMHIRRKDFLWKMLAYVICMIHWFNPLVWVAYYFLGSDIEKACDEEVIRNLGEEKKKDYAYALLQAATGTLNKKKKVFVAPICFDEGNVKGRIKNIVKYKYTLLAVEILVVVGILVLAIVFMTSTNSDKKSGPVENETSESKVVLPEQNKEMNVPGNADEVLKTLEFSLQDGERVTLSVIGKKDNNTSLYGVREIVVYIEDNLVQSILMEEVINANGVDGIDTGYSECASIEGTAGLQDVNFDGYLDLAVCAWIPNNSIPYYCWCWNPDTQQFEYAFCLQLTEVDEVNEQLVSWYKEENGVYHTDYYHVNADNELELVDRQIEDVRSQKRTETSELSEEERMAAYRSVLENVFYYQDFPDGLDRGYDGLSLNKYAIFDIDFDGNKELIIAYTSTYMAGMETLIYDFDEETGTAFEEFSEFPSLTFYTNGVIVANASHNHGRASSSEDFWPYTLYKYNEATDTYLQIAMVDAWASSYADMVGGESFPKETDADNDGMVYYIMTGGEYVLETPIDNAEYLQWWDSYVGEAHKIRIPYLDLTEENINSIG